MRSNWRNRDRNDFLDFFLILWNGKKILWRWDEVSEMTFRATNTYLIKILHTLGTFGNGVYKQDDKNIA